MEEMQPSPKALKIVSVDTILLENERLDELLAMFAFSFKEPVTVLENPNFVNLVKALRPEYKMPSKKKLCSTLLDKCHKKVQAVEREKTREKLSFLYLQLNSHKFDSRLE